MRFPNMNFHTHTTYCDGKETAEQMVQAAIAKGFTRLGFSGHGFNDFRPEDQEVWCMRPEDVPKYQAEVRALAEKYQDKIEILCGVEQDACIGYLRRQAALLRPKIIVCLGRIAAMRIIKPDFKITREHGQWFEKSGIQMMAVYHPAALLRDPRRRPETFEDFKALQQKINELCEHTHAVS